MLREFKEFAVRGNVVDMAVGIVIGVSFGKIVASLVKDVVMPPIGLLVGGVKFSALTITLQSAPNPVTINIGVFANTIVEFIIVALVLFVVVKTMNQLKRKQVEAPAEAPPPPQDVQLLMDIRDLLREQAGKAGAGRPTREE